MFRPLMIVAVVLLFLGSGCRRDQADPTVYGDVMKLEGSERGLLPVRVPERKGDSALGAIPAAEAPAKAEAGAPKVDDSSADGLAKAFMQMASDNDWKRLPDLLVTEQADSIREMIDALAPFATSLGELNRAFQEKMPGHAVQLKLDDVWMQHIADMTAGLRIDKVEPVGDAEARVHILVGPADVPEPKKLELTAKKVEDKWRITLPDFQAPSDPKAVGKALEGKEEAFKDIAGRVAKDDLKDADAVQAEAAKAMEGKYEAKAEAAPAEQQAKPKPGPKPGAKPMPPKPGPKKPTPKPRERDAVDDTAPLPVLPRG